MSVVRGIRPFGGAAFVKSTVSAGEGKMEFGETRATNSLRHGCSKLFNLTHDFKMMKLVCDKVKNNFVKKNI